MPADVSGAHKDKLLTRTQGPHSTNEWNAQYLWQEIVSSLLGITGDTWHWILIQHPRVWWVALDNISQDQGSSWTSQIQPRALFFVEGLWFRQKHPNFSHGTTAAQQNSVNSFIPPWSPGRSALPHFQTNYLTPKPAALLSTFLIKIPLWGQTSSCL